MNKDLNQKKDITNALVTEHRLILRMIALLERNAPLTADGSYTNWQFYLDGVDFIRNFADRFHHAKEEDVLFEALVKTACPENSPIAAMLMEHDQGRAFVKPWRQPHWRRWTARPTGAGHRRQRLDMPRCCGNISQRG
jgi:hemerythrin-like domain-containing protein